MHKERLLKLAEHLETGKLGHEVFDFSQYNNSGTNICGTAGCAIGECPIIWPNEWVFNWLGTPILKDENNSLKSAIIFFQIKEAERMHLFEPNKQIISLYDGEHLFSNATKEQVAANIREFVKRKENETI